jgi:hypothetical protein
MLSEQTNRDDLCPCRQWGTLPALWPGERARTVTLLTVKLVAELVSGVAAFAHEPARSSRGLAVWVPLLECPRW